MPHSGPGWIRLQGKLNEAILLIVLVFPGLEVVADIPFERGDGPGKSDFAEVSIIPQARIGLKKDGHNALNFGVEVPVNETDRFDYVAQMNLLWDFADGPSWKGS